MTSPLPPRLSRRAPMPKPGIVHLGPGAFFRAFNAPYTDAAMTAEGGDWGIVAISLRSATAWDQLQPQDGAYTAVELSPDGNHRRIINAISEVLVAPKHPDEVEAALTSAETKLVTLTITEKGYRVPDLSEPDWRKSAIGLLVSALGTRWRLGRPPITVLSCDNLPNNGATAKAACLALAERLDPSLARWIDDYIPFPSCMVDRITPATTDADIAALAEAAGYHDPAMVVHEPFRQWVIEDRFAQGRPAWDAAGAQFVQSVDAHELMKLRCLNGTHSTLAYLGYLAGHETISNCVADPIFADLCQRLWADEIVPTLPQPESEDLPTYCDALLARYQNPAIRHRTWQIAMDGSQKLPQRILGTIQDGLSAGRVSRGLCLAVAGWMRYVGGIDETGQPIDVRDPLATDLKAASDEGSDPADIVSRLLAFDAIFPADLAQNALFQDAVTTAYADLVAHGAKAAVRTYLSS